MRRQLDPAVQAAFDTGRLRPFVAAALTFRSKTEFCWTGIGNLVIGGITYLGVGAFGRVGTVTEGTEVRADGTTVGLTAIDPDLYQECMNDIQQGLPAKLYAGVLTDTGQVIRLPHLFFSGSVDSSSVEISPQSMTMTLNLEHLMSELQRAPMIRYTSADQNLLYPTDSAFDYVETLNDAPLRWGN